MRACKTTGIGVAMAFAAGLSVPAFAQIEEVVVTARKREENLQSVPVAVTAFSNEQLKQFATHSLQDVAEMTPGFLIGPNQGQVGGTMSLRGVSTGAGNASSDQSISVNVDGVQISKANVLRLGQRDLEQVQVLKGPQALFFGKNSPGGIVVLKTADPTEKLFLEGTVGHEAKAAQTFGEVVLSGPLSEAVGARAYFYASDQDGPFENVARPSVAGSLADSDGPAWREYAGRLTLAFQPSEALSAKLKLNYSDVDAAGPASTTQRFNCDLATGGSTSVLSSADTCKLDEEFVKGDPRIVAGLDPSFRDGVPYLEMETFLGSLEVSYDFMEKLSLTSVTGYYYNKTPLFDNYGSSEQTILAAASRPTDRQLSQELRFNTRLSGPINFMFGGYYDDRSFKDRNAVFFGAFYGAPKFKVDSHSYSVFGQVTANVTDALEIAGGVRYSNETREVDGTYSGLSIPYSPDERTFKNTSPEATVTWRPQENVTLYGAYKEGFKSGGFNTTFGSAGALVAAGPSDVSFSQEKVQGGEVGLKSTWFERTLRVNVDAYYYDYRDLQLETFIPGASLTQLVTNAGAVTVKGAELELLWDPRQAQGLTLMGGLSLNRARYDRFDAPCPTASLTAPSCTSTQDLSGERVIQAPDVGANVGFTYDMAIAGDYRLTLGSTASYKSKYNTVIQNVPAAEQKAFWLLAASLKLSAENGGWDVSLIGKNLTNEFYVVTGAEDPLGTGEVYGNVNNPRQIILQVTFRPAEMFGK